jgi:hypothetical protein
MKITICGSIAFYKQMQEIQRRLENVGNEVKLPPSEVMDVNGKIISVTDYYDLRKSETNDDSWIWQRKRELIKNHFDEIAWCDAILVLNYDKNGVANYIGGNTFMEMGVAFYLDKPIYLWQPIPEISYKEEILSMFPIVISGDIKKI